jgi:acetyl esterase/lipase
MDRTWKKRAVVGFVPGAIGLAALVTASRQLPRWQLAKRVVAPELYSPLLFTPTSVTSRRRIRVRRAMPQAARVPDGIRHEIRSAAVEGRNPVPVHVYEPARRSGPSGVLYWIHGGGFVMGSPEVGHEFCGEVAAELGVLVVSVDYRLAPEHPFPIPLEDTYTGLRWLHDHAGELDIDPDRIAVGGQSAGGGLAACVAQLAYDRGEVRLCFQLLVYPMLDDRSVLRSDHAGTGDFMWDPKSNRFGWTCYLGHAPSADPAPDYAAAARREHLSGLPRAWIGVGDIDLFHAEDVTYAERLRSAGVDVDLVVVPGMYHGADSIPGLANAPSMVSFNRSKRDALGSAIGQTGSPRSGPPRNGEPSSKEGLA